MKANCECNCGHRFIGEIDPAKPPKVRRTDKGRVKTYVMRCVQCDRHVSAPAFKKWTERTGEE